MLINKDTTIIGNKVILIPYKKDHVLKYHEWMKSEELLRLTGSESLSLEEEYNMQQSWLIDANSVECTFIILDKEKYETTMNEIDSMIGDTNLFFAGFDDTLTAEAEIMIAEEWARGKGCGLEAMLIMLLYGIELLHVKHYIVKITMENTASLHMFEKINFIETSRSIVFSEITLEKVVDSNWIMWIKNLITPKLIIKEY